MLWGNKKTKIVHYQQCRFAESRSESGWVHFTTIEEAYANGYKLCDYCSPLVRDIRCNKNECLDRCQRKGLNLFMRDGVLFIGTLHSNWYLRPCSKHKYELFHRNTLGKTEQYHLQRTFSQNILYVLDYIARHEDYRFRNPIEYKPKKRHKRGQPRKGTKRYKSLQQKLKAQRRSRSIRNVLELIEQMEKETE